MTDRIKRNIRSARGIMASRRTLVLQVWLWICAFFQWISIQNASTLPQWNLDYDPSFENGRILFSKPVTFHGSSHQKIGPNETKMNNSASNDSSILSLLNPSSLQRALLRETVAAMPRPSWGGMENITLFSSWDDVDSYSVQVPWSLSGCEPKFNIHFQPNETSVSFEFLFKPARWAPFHAVNELIAYHVDQLLCFYRVPPVLPMQIPYHQKLLPALQLAQKLQQGHKSIFRCNMRLSDDDTQEWVLVPPKGSQVYNQHGENDTLVAIGAMQLKVSGIGQRNDVVRFVEKQLKRVSQSATERLQSMIFPRTPSIFAQREVGTRAIFDYLIGNRDRFSNDHIVSLADGHNRILAYIDNNRVETENTAAFDLEEWTKDCRFYYTPVQKLMDMSQERYLSPSMKTSMLNGLSVRLWTRLKYHQPNPFRKIILGWFDPPNQIIRHGDISFFYHLHKRTQHILQRVEVCLQQKGFHHVFVEQ